MCIPPPPRPKTLRPAMPGGQVHPRDLWQPADGASSSSPPQPPEPAAPAPRPPSPAADPPQSTDTRSQAGGKALLVKVFVKGQHLSGCIFCSFIGLSHRQNQSRKIGRRTQFCDSENFELLGWVLVIPLLKGCAPPPGD